MAHAGAAIAKVQEQALAEQAAYEQALAEQAAYEQALAEQAAYEQALAEQAAYIDAGDQGVQGCIENGGTNDNAFDPFAE